MNGKVVRRVVVMSAAAAALLTPGCRGADSAAGRQLALAMLRERVEARFKQEGIRLYEADEAGDENGFEEVGLAPFNRQRFGAFVVHVVTGASGFGVAESNAHARGPGGVLWDDRLARHRPASYTAFKRYGRHLELEWTSPERSIEQPHWRELDAILRGLNRDARSDA